MGGVGGTGSLQQTGLTITKQDGTIYAKIPVKGSGLGTLGGTGYGSQVQNIIRLKVQGDVQSITPTNYVQNGDSYVWDASQVSGGAIEVVYKPSGFALSGTLMIILIVGIVAVVVIVLLAFFLMRKGVSAPAIVPSATPARAVPPAPPAAKANPKAVKYAKAQIKAGDGAAEIKSALQQSGYTDAEIDASIKKAMGS